MSVERIASRYAKSLLDLATEKGQLEKVYEDICLFTEVNKHADFRNVVKSPIINHSTKQAIFDDIFKGKIGDLTDSYFRLIIKKNRETELDSIAKAFIDLYKKNKNISTVSLITANEIGPEVMEQIMAELNKSSNTDKHIELETKVDPSLIGGYILEFDNKLYDASVAYKLELLKKEFSKNEYIKNL